MFKPNMEVKVAGVWGESIADVAVDSEGRYIFPSKEALEVFLEGIHNREGEGWDLYFTPISQPEIYQAKEVMPK